MKAGRRSLNLTKLVVWLAYWVVLVPIAMIYKIFGVKSLNFDWKPGEEDSYWEERKNPESVKDRYNRQS